MSDASIVHEPQLQVDHLGHELRATLYRALDRRPGAGGRALRRRPRRGRRRRAAHHLRSLAISTGSTRSAPGSSTAPATISARRAPRPISSARGPSTTSSSTRSPIGASSRSRSSSAIACVDLLVDIGQSGGPAPARTSPRASASSARSWPRCSGVATRPRRFRGPSLVHQLELIAFRGVPIIALISFLVGAIVAQQGIFQLRNSARRPSSSTSSAS